MAKRVILTFLEGTFETGFLVMLRIQPQTQLGAGNTYPSRHSDRATLPASSIQVLGKLPPCPEILQCFQEWQSVYHQMVMPSARLKPKPAQITNVSCHQIGYDLAERLNDWLNSSFKEWQKIRDGLQRNLNETDEIQVILETDDIYLRRLPWHEWDLFAHHYTQAEVALSLPDYQPLPKSKPLTNPIHILAILGDSTGIDIQTDRRMLEQLPHARTTVLVEPQRQELNECLWERPWQILFFAGHSMSEESGESGRLYINRRDSLSIAELKHALRRAITQGVQIAIFNSCDGLGLARELAELQIPQIIVMREPVPDPIAQEFLQHFLKSFAAGKPLYLAVREARERLQGREHEFPFASWLPVICQNPSEVSPTWQQLLGKTSPYSQTIPQQIIKTVLLGLISIGSAWIITTFSRLFLGPFPFATVITHCQGDSCIGRDPIDNKCDLDAETITSTVGNINISEGRIATFKVELRHSDQCQASWVRTTGSFLLTDYLKSDYLVDRKGNHYGQANVLETFKDHYGDMGPSDLELKACVQPLKGEPTCTNFVKP